MPKDSRKKVLWLLVTLVIIVLVLIIGSVIQQSNQSINLPNPNGNESTSGNNALNIGGGSSAGNDQADTTVSDSLTQTDAALKDLNALSAELDASGLDSLTDDLNGLDSQLNKL